MPWCKFVMEYQGIADLPEGRQAGHVIKKIAR